MASPVANGIESTQSRSTGYPPSISRYWAFAAFLRPYRSIRHSSSARRYAVALCALAAAACASPTDANGVRVVSTAVTTPAPFVRTLHVELDRPSELTVEYWTDGDAHLRVQAPAAQSASVALTRLRPSKSYHYQVVGTSASGTFTSDTVPTDLAASLVSST